MSLESSDIRAAGLRTNCLRGYETSMQKMVKLGVLPGCASVVFRKGVVAHTGKWGYADVERRTKFDFDTQCRMFCATKTFIGFAMMRLVEQGLVTVEDRLDTWIPAFGGARVHPIGAARVVAAKQPIRLKHLLSHTSGISYPPDAGDDTECEEHVQYRKLQAAAQTGAVGSLKAFIDRLAKIPLLCHPGEKYYYGFSYDVLGRVLEVAYRKPLDKCLSELVFEPLGMSQTGWALQSSQLSHASSCYCSTSTWGHVWGDVEGAVPSAPRSGLVRLDGAQASNCNWYQGSQCKVLSGGGFMGYLHGGLLSTVRDTAKFVRMLLNYGVTENGVRLLSASSVKDMERNRLTKAVGGSNRVCYLGNIGAFRQGGKEFGMGGAACTYWSIDRTEDVATVWFAQHVDLPDVSEVEGIDPAKADLWALLHKLVTKKESSSAKKKRTRPTSSSASSSKRARTAL
mmetsp:Transcript_19412/g.35170  ORF Transcript_19412/g.35170 Transcript_19412/m.35170 type:complete len:455 (-) Transcript_19412:66-1430(-)